MPKGLRRGGFVLILGSHRTKGAAGAQLARLRQRGIHARIARSGGVAALRSGFVVVYTGAYRTQAAARRAQGKIGGYVRPVGRG